MSPVIRKNTPTLVLIKIDRQMGFHVDRATHRFWFLVKRGRQMGSPVGRAATPILASVNGNHQMEFQVDQAIQTYFGSG